MTDTKISDELPAGTLDGTELTEVVQAGNNRRATTQAIANLALPNGTTGTGAAVLADTPTIDSPNFFGPNTGLEQPDSGGVFSQFIDGLGRPVLQVRGGIDGTPPPTDAVLNVGGNGNTAYSIDTAAGVRVGENLTVVGTASATTAAVGTSTTQLATTAFVQANQLGVNVRSFGARGDGVTDDSGAINAAIASLATQRGGIVYMPPGNYVVASTITITNSIILMGAGQGATFINGTAYTGNTIDIIAAGGAGLQNMLVQGFRGNSGTVVDMPYDSVNNNVGNVLRDVTIQYGSIGINVGGSDCILENLFVGYQYGTASVLSNTANWYVRCKFDSGSSDQPFPTYAFIQGATPVGFLSPAENHFVQCDFSGPFGTSIVIDDGSNTTSLTTAIMTFSGCVIAPTGTPYGTAFQINGARWVCISECEVGGLITNTSDLAVITVGNSWLSLGPPITVATPGSSVKLIGNCFNIS